MDILLVGIFLGLVQVGKIAFKLAKRWIPLFSVLLALIVWIAYAYFTKAPIGWELISQALIAGLASCGLWDLGKVTVAAK